MGTNTCDGDAYVHNLATFIRAHERQLANALVAYKKSAKLPNNPNSTASNAKPPPMPITKPVRLSMSLHHLYFLLGRLQDLGIETGPMNIRLDTIDSETSGNYVSFLSEFQRKKLIPSADTQSIHSMSSVKSVMSSVSALWNSLGGGNTKYDNIAADLRYLYSAFSKLPCLRLANDPKAKLIEGHEEYPFETATPIAIFQNLVVLEVCEIDPKEVYGWDILAAKVRYLVIKKSAVQDPYDILVTLVNDDSEKRGSSLESAVIDDEPPVTALAISPHQQQQQQQQQLLLQQPPQIHGSASAGTGFQSQSQSSLGDQLSTGLSSSSSFRNRQYYYYQQPAQQQQHRGRIQRSNSVLSDGPGSVTSDDGPEPFERQSVSTSATATTTMATTPQLQTPTTSAFASAAALSAAAAASNDTLRLTSTSSHSSNGAASSSVPTAPPSAWKLLKHLSFAENHITQITSASFANLNNLSSLDLSYNRLAEIPAGALSHLKNLKSLNLACNRLETTRGFPALTKLSILNLRGNRLKELDSLENLPSLEKLDLRHNKIAKTADLKPLLMTCQDTVRLRAIYLTGNPLSSTRGYRIELFNLFNGVDYSNSLKIDGSRPGIFESRLLLDPKNAKLHLHKFMDASIISRMTASISTMNLSKVITTTTSTTTAHRPTADRHLPVMGQAQAQSQRHQQQQQKKSQKAKVSSVAKTEQKQEKSPLVASTKAPAASTALVSSTSGAPSEPHLSAASPVTATATATSTATATAEPTTSVVSDSAQDKVSSNKSSTNLQTSKAGLEVLTLNQNVINTTPTNSFIQPPKPFAPQITRPSAGSRTPSAISTLIDQEKRKSDSVDSITSSKRSSQDSNPITKISISCVALPVITQTTTMTTTPEEAVLKLRGQQPRQRRSQQPLYEHHHSPSPQPQQQQQQQQHQHHQQQQQQQQQPLSVYTSASTAITTKNDLKVDSGLVYLLGQSDMKDVNKEISA